MRTLARRFGLVAKPRADRWHRRPTALFGGVGMFLAVLVALLIRPRDFAGDQLLLLCCGAGMFLLGLVDDVVQLRPYAKLVGQIVFATAFTLFGLRLHWLSSPVLDQALTIFWLVGIANAVNLLDNLDGLAGGVAAIAAAFLIYICHISGQHGPAGLAAIFCGAVVGFLFFNFNPASIFMGDCGSLFLGFFLGGLTLVPNKAGNLGGDVLAVLAVPVLLLMIPIVDTTLVTISRKFHGRAVSQGGRDHTSHRLVALGLSERKAALVLWAPGGRFGRDRGPGAAAGVAGRDHPGPDVWHRAAVLPGSCSVGCGSTNRSRRRPWRSRAGPSCPRWPTWPTSGGSSRSCTTSSSSSLAYYSAFLLRFDGQLVQPFFGQFRLSLPIVIVVQVTTFLVLGLYRGLWRYTSMSDLSTLVRAVAGAWMATVATLYAGLPLRGLVAGGAADGRHPARHAPSSAAAWAFGCCARSSAACRDSQRQARPHLRRR